VTVDVAKGVVEVESHGEIQRVGAGQHWSSSGGVAAPHVPPALTPPAASASPDPASPGAAAADPVGPLEGTTVPPPSPQPAASTSRVRPPRAQRRTHALVQGAAAGTSASPTSGSTLAGTSRQAQYERAEGIEPNDPEGAFVIYRRVAEGNDAWASAALFSAGRIAFERGTGGEAEELFEEYLQRFPHGSQAGDARDYLANIRRLLAR
jgi:hypothetical protein